MSTLAFRTGGMLTFRWAPDPLIVASDFDKAAAYVDNMQPPLQTSRQLAQADIRENFEAEHDPGGAPWAPWSESYVASGPPGDPEGILKLTHDLMDSATSASAYPITARELFFDFSTLPFYGIFHQAGASRQAAGRGVTKRSNVETTKVFGELGAVPMGGRFGSNDLPARPFAGIEDETQFQIMETFEAWFAGAIGFAMGSSGVVQTRLPSGRFGPKVA
jgi:phage gpG-like protein